VNDIRREREAMKRTKILIPIPMGILQFLVLILNKIELQPLDVINFSLVK
jgi:hypothetical protein